VCLQMRMCFDSCVAGGAPGGCITMCYDANGSLEGKNLLSCGLSRCASVCTW
jgi:hypothetical protein